MLRFIVPFAVFIVLVVFFIIGLQKDPRKIPSALLDKPAPEFTLPQLNAMNTTFSPEQMKGKVWMLNVWASWCASCRDEHPLFLDISRKGTIDIVGLNYKDKPNDGRMWLQRLGNPYTLIAADLKGDVGIDYGVYGVPESFIIDKQGVIRYKHVGPVSRQDWQETILPIIEELRG
jgi:cytochrome c biogenesis protein CcmG/thiol:disulfide interchange protein DsbE